MRYTYKLALIFPFIAVEMYCHHK